MGAAERLGFSTARLERIDRFLAEHYVAAGRLPCADLTIARRGEVVHRTLVGRRDLERDLPVTEDTVFRIYSMTKPITSVVAMMLVEEGRLALDEPVPRYIPAFEFLSVYKSGLPGAWTTRPPERPMQIVDLLRHTSGLTYYIHYRTSVDAAYRAIGLEAAHGPRDLAGMIAELSELPLDFSPGEAWNYSISTDVLGYVIEQITGQSLDQVFQERIFGPLKMTDTGFYVREDQRARFAAGYEARPDDGLKLSDDPATSPYLNPPAMLSGGGGLVSTSADYLRFCAMLANGGELDGARILAPRTVKLMASNHLPGGGDLTLHSRSLFSESTNAGIGFGLGFAVAFDPVKAMLPSSPGEFYWGGAASTTFWVDPVEEISVVFMTQRLPSSSTNIRRELRTLVYSALIEPNG
jgi:CubicO group peptidase (beta-lactamase class C family)